MSLNRAAHRAAPLLRTRAFRGNRPLPARIPAIAILIPRRALSTETPSSRGTSGGPPPGFDIEMAKRPMKKDARDADKDAPESKGPAGQAVTAKTVAKAEEEASTLTELAAQKEREKGEDKAVAKKKSEKKLTIWQKVKKEVVHYWDGTKLLAAEVRISSRLALKMAAGYELTRRENRQVSRSSMAELANPASCNGLSKTSDVSFPSPYSSLSPSPNSSCPSCSGSSRTSFRAPTNPPRKKKPRPPSSAHRAKK
jgi:LETM1 and EF-hand domain-containing protein 1